MTTTPEQDTDKALRRALADPGSVTPRMLDQTADQYEPLTEWQLRAVRIAALPLIRADERERCAVHMEALAGNYPEDVFPPGSGSRDAIGGTAMRHAYRNAARSLRESPAVTEGTGK